MTVPPPARTRTAASLPEPWRADAAAWARSLRAARRSERTIGNYLDVLDAHARWLAGQDPPVAAPADVRRADVEDYLAGLAGRGVSAATVATHFRCLRVWWRWWAAWQSEDGPAVGNPMERVVGPEIPRTPVALFTPDEVRALLRACDAAAAVAPFPARRDAAIIRLFYDTGLRLSELAGLRWGGDPDVDLDGQTVRVVGKGGHVRVVPYGARTGQALDRYLRVRARQRRAGLPALWLADKGPLTANGIYQALRRRGEQAGVADVRPHRFRHTFADAFLAAGGSGDDLQRLAGWSSPKMLAVYGAVAADRRAHAAHRRLGLGDLL